jgi:protein-tyrosine phosphatase
MIDLHCHLLPGIDDGPADLATSIEMACIAVADGIGTVFCTPHIYPGLYENRGGDIQARVASLQQALNEKSVALNLSYGADTHLVPDMLPRLRSGDIPTLAGSRYLLLEPSHTVRPPRFVESVFELVANGYIPVITHPERLTWAHDHYGDFVALAKSGAWLQVTAGALIGHFGRGAQRLSERFIGEGWTAVLATDAHTTNRRAPRMAEAHERAAKLVGREEADRLVRHRPSTVLFNRPPEEQPPPPALAIEKTSNQGTIRGFLSTWFTR